MGAALRAPIERLPVHEDESDTIEQKQTFNSAFGKVNYDPTSRLRTSFSVLWTPTTSKGTLPAYNDSIANSISSSRASNQIQKTRGFEIPQTSYAGTLDFTLTSSSLVSVRGGYFDDNYRDTGVPTFSSVSYQTSAIGLGYPIPARPARRRRLPEHPARPARGSRPHQAGLRAG